MKVGSMVECIDNSDFADLPKPKLKQPYTVSSIGSGFRMANDGLTKTGKRGACITLEEIDTGIYAYGAEAFRELLPPMEIQEALDSCEPVLIELNP